MTRTEYPWLLPSALADHEPPGHRGRPPRTVRDWVVDITLFLCAAAFGTAALAAVDADHTTPDGVVLVDSVLGAAAAAPSGSGGGGP